ncbi:demethylmenaquinone methyltransferase/2-methoxy-6-polyprenyl-1 [Elusimicrobium posterum]|uniref:class I SAM-dependent DNA methyltransferase n=1 Tax=Elusimicrobium posterum TaxID=3116653 RepID=UPI003C77FFFB
MDKEQQIAFFDACASDWDAKLRPGELDIVAQIIEKIGVKLGDKIIDIGCGTGILYPFVSKYQPAQILSIDLSSNMLKEFKQKHPEAELMKADFEKINLDENSFDKIIAFNVFPHFQDRAAVFNNAYKFLKTGGTFTICHSMTREELALVHAKREAVKNDKLPSAEEMRRLYETAGFKEVTVEEKAPGFFARGVKYI